MSIRTTRRALLLAGTTLIGALSAGPALAAGGGEVYRDPHAPIAERVRDLLGRMTLEEKAQQLRCLWFGKAKLFDAAGDFSPEKAAQAIPLGIGQIASPGDEAGTPRFLTAPYRDPANSIALANAIQRFHVERTRLGIPVLFHSEAAHGFVGSEATIFPSPPALGSTWDPPLVEQVFTVAAREARLRGNTVVLCPVLDLARDPRYGRVEEFFGEDPCHVGAIGTAAVRGLQGRQRPIAGDRVFATLKHFVHAVPQGGLNTAPADIGERNLRENFLVPFAKVIKAADPAIVMPSYNELDGVPSHANFVLLQKTGRNLLGFQGAYFSDYSGVTNLFRQHHMAASNDDAAVLAMLAGVDAELPEGEAYAQLPALVRAGRVPEARLDEAVSRVLRLKFEAGLFENPYVDAAAMARGTCTPAAVALARTAAQRALVLLKNDGVLPLDPKARLRLAVIGPNADGALVGGYSGTNSQAVGVLAGLKAAAGPNITIDHAEGVRILASRPGQVQMKLAPEPSALNAPRIAEAVAVAQRSDVVLLVLGDRPEITREAVVFASPGDRDTLNLFGDQDRLAEAILATGKPVIALLLNGRPLAVGQLADKANALLEGWYGGQQGGHAVADVLFGKVNPGGKLAVSFPRTVGDVPIYYNRHPSADSNQYVEGPRKPLFPFGYGLSYTSFELSEPRLARDTIGKGEGATIEVDVANTGMRAGDEVVQVYIRDDVSSVPRPVLELRAFQRVTLKPGEKRTLSFALTPDDLAFWDIAMNWTVEPGTFTVYAGNSSANLKSARLTVA